VPQQNIVFHELLKQIPWAAVDRLAEQFGADGDPRRIKAKVHLIAMLEAQFSRVRGLREVEANLTSHAGKLYHLGGRPIYGAALSISNALRPVEP